MENNWISVKDKLPKAAKGQATEVIINSHVATAKYKDVVVCGVYYNKNFYICAEWNEGDPDMIQPIEKRRITHWQPLPSPPQS